MGHRPSRRTGAVVAVTVIVDPEAQAEFDEGYDFYEMRGVGLGEAFADAVGFVFDRIGAMPRQHRLVFGNIRRAVVRGYPYCVYYREEPSQVRVLSVFHTSRNPSIWQSRN